MKRITMAVSTALIAAFIAATPAFNAKGNTIYWTVSDEFVNNINFSLVNDELPLRHYEYLSITVYLFSFDYYENELFLPLNADSHINIDVGQAYSSIPLWEYDEEDSYAPVVAEATVGKFYADSIPFENNQNQVVLLTVLQYKDPDESKLHGIIGINPNFSFIDLEEVYYWDPYTLPDDDNPLVLGDNIFDWPFNGTYEIIPEPATGLLVLGGAAIVLLRRRRR